MRTSFGRRGVPGKRPVYKRKVDMDILNSLKSVLVLFTAFSPTILSLQSNSLNREMLEDENKTLPGFSSL